MKALWMAEENCLPAQHLYPSRCAGPRSLELVEVHRRGALPFRARSRSDVCLAPWSASGNARIQEVLRQQQCYLYANMNNQVLHYANQGVTINEIHNVYEVPKGLQNLGIAADTTIAATQRARRHSKVFRICNCNPATLIPLSPARNSAPLYVEMMGETDKIMTRGRQLHDDGQYLLATEILNKLVQAQPENAEAKDLLADVFEQLGYQQENPGLRNSSSLRPMNSAPASRKARRHHPVAPTSSGRCQPELFLNFLAIRMDSRQAEGLKFTATL